MSDDNTNDNSPYQTPAADLNVPAGSNGLGGSIENTLDGNAELDFSDVFREAWERTKGIKTIVIVGGIIAGVVAMVISALTGGLSEDQGIGGALIGQVLTSLALAPISAGIMMTGIRRSVDLPVDFGQLWAYISLIVTLFLITLLTSIATTIGFILLILPGIYLSLALSLAVPLHVDKGLGVVDALMTSLKLVNKKFWMVLGLYIVAGLAMMLGFITIIGWIWTLPLAVMVFAITYRQLAGVSQTA